MAKFLIPFAIMLTLVFSDFGLTGGAQVAFYLGMNILFWLFLPHWWMFLRLPWEAKSLRTLLEQRSIRSSAGDR